MVDRTLSISLQLTVNISAYFFGSQNLRRNLENGAFRQKTQCNYVGFCLKTLFMLQGLQSKGGFIWKGFKIISPPFTTQFPFIYFIGFNIVIPFLYNANQTLVLKKKKRTVKFRTDLFWVTFFFWERIKG